MHLRRSRLLCELNPIKPQANIKLKKKCELVVYRSYKFGLGSRQDTEASSKRTMDIFHTYRITVRLHRLIDV